MQGNFRLSGLSAWWTLLLWSMGDEAEVRLSGCSVQGMGPGSTWPGGLKRQALQSVERWPSIHMGPNALSR